MKKLALMMAVSVLASALFAGCGSSKGVEVDLENLPTYEQLAVKTYEDDAYVQNLDVSKYVTLGEYKGLEVSVEKVHVDDEEVESYIQTRLTLNPMKVEITDRAVEEGDIVNIDYIGLYLGGIEFEGGTAQDQDLEIGSDTYIDGFEDGVIGMKTGEVKHLELTFPEDYGNTDLAGQDVVFVVTLNKIFKEEPAELNDEWVASLEIDNVATVEEYRDYVHFMYMDQEMSRYDSDVKNGLFNQAMANTEFSGNYTPVWQRYFDMTLMNILYQISYYGFDMETFAMLYSGMGVEELINDMIASAEVGARETLMVAAIAKAEGIEVTEEAVQAELEYLAEMYGFATVEEYVAAAGDPSATVDFQELLLTDAVMEFLAENAVVTEVEPAAEAE